MFILTRLIAPALLSIVLALSAVAQEPEAPTPIEDNSFLIEEAYNQKDREVQHILTIQRDNGSESISLNFAQEWPLFGQAHQISYDVPFDHVGSGPSAVRGLGDISINYRYQMLGIDAGTDVSTVAFAPRLSIILPTGNETKGLGYGVLGGAINLPLSVIAGPVVFHSNAGVMLAPKAKLGGDFATTITEFNLGQSAVWLVHPKFNVLVEALWDQSSFRDINGDVVTERSFLINPGVRWAYDFDSGLQIVPGVSVPITLAATASTQVFVYLSFEHNF